MSIIGNNENNYSNVSPIVSSSPQYLCNDVATLLKGEFRHIARI